ncbi:hypothetical protein E2C01_066234 [Portunus trituberculatus]|uniref:Uncharacterized protein n=1 Tax=Portunus trituberculatus TaxID=210409 RepID=A0A5B7HKZ1_PORTR|nr:hypothetical protein [Portunus trituberculatus]
MMLMLTLFLAPPSSPPPHTPFPFFSVKVGGKGKCGAAPPPLPSAWPYRSSPSPAAPTITVFDPEEGEAVRGRWLWGRDL